MDNPAKVLIISAEPKAGALWQEAFAGSELAARLAVATTGMDGLLAIGEDPPAAAVIVHDPPAIDAPSVVRGVHQDYPDLPLLVYASDAQAMAEVLDDKKVVAGWADESKVYRSTAPGILVRMLGPGPGQEESAPRAAAPEAALSIALDIAGRAGHEANAAMQSVYEQIGRLRAVLTPANAAAQPALASMDISLRQAMAMTERILQCAKGPQGARIRIGLHDLLRSVLQALRSQLGARFSPELRLKAMRTEIEAEVFPLCQALVRFFQVWAETYGAIAGRLTLATDNSQPGGATTPTGQALTLKASEVRLRVVGRGEKAVGPEFDPAADPDTVQSILPVGPLAEALRSCGGRLQMGLGPSREPLVALAFPLAQTDARQDTTTVLADLRGSGHILLAEDELIVRALAEKMLTGLGYTLSAAVDGKSALRAFEADPAKFDVVLADMFLPDMSAEELFQALKTIRPEVRFVLACDNPNLAATIVIGPGAYAGVIQKPYRTRDLGARLLKILSH